MSNVDAFLALSERTFKLSREIYERFLSDWYLCHTAYGLDANSFLEGTAYTPVSFRFHGTPVQGIALEAPNFEKRRELMKNQKKYAPRQADLTTYASRFIPSTCFLCQNVAQAFDTAGLPPGQTNCIHTTDQSILVPNRYPGHAGHSLLLPCAHDDMTNRISPVRDETGLNVYAPVEGKTRGAVMEKNDFAEVFHVARRFGLFATSNHALDDMSIPGHRHFHLQPHDLPVTTYAEEIIGTPEQGAFPDGVYRPQHTPFDTLLIRERTSPRFVETVTSITERLERDHQVFTLLYLKGDFFISPRQHVASRLLHIGSGSPLHWVKNDSAYFASLETHIPRKGTFPWERYVFPA